jgi:hypothetical protein
VICRGPSTSCFYGEIFRPAFYHGRVGRYFQSLTYVAIRDKLEALEATGGIYTVEVNQLEVPSAYQRDIKYEISDYNSEISYNVSA